jgi:hypothetical protein
MRPIAIRDWFLRLASLAAMVAAFLVALDHPLHAQNTTLIISDFGTGSLSLFPIVNGTPGTPTTVSSGTGFAPGEGAACLGTSQIFVADNGSSIYTYNLTTKTSALFATVTTPDIGTGQLPAFTSLSLSSDGKILYAAGDNDSVYGFYTSGGTPIPNSPLHNPAAKWHDIVAAGPGFAYATDFQTSSQGVALFNFNTGSVNLNFIPPPTGGAYAGLTFDTLGNLWVSDFGSTTSNNATRPGVYEFSPSGALLAKITSPLFNNPLGLAIGPGDGDIYVANFSSNQILKITVGGFTTNPATNSPLDPVSIYIPTAANQQNAGSNPKYLLFQQNCVNPNGLLKICKVAGPGIAVGTPFTFTAGSSPVTVPAGPAPGGTCALGPSLAVGTNATVIETIPSGDAVSNITVAPPGQSVSTNLATGTATVTIGSGVTEVTYTDYTTMGYLEICKQGDVNTKGNFSFTVNPGNLGPFSVPLGACTPAIQVTAGPVVITEASTPGIVMSGCSTIPGGQQGTCNTPPNTSTVTVAPGDLSTETVAIITNRRGGQP